MAKRFMTNPDGEVSVGNEADYEKKVQKIEKRVSEMRSKSKGGKRGKVTPPADVQAETAAMAEAAALNGPVENSPAGEIPLASGTGAGVTSESNSETAGAMTATGQEPTGPAAMTAAAGPAGTAEGKMEQTLTLTKSTKARKDDRIVIFQGPLHAVQFLRSAFGETVPETITVTGDFAEPSVRAPKAKETPEERKARLAALPKPTLEEKVKKAEERAAKLREKLAKKAEAPAAEGQPATV